MPEAKQRRLSADRKEDLQMEADVSVKSTTECIEELHRDAYSDVMENNWVRKEIARQLIAWALEFQKPQRKL